MTQRRWEGDRKSGLSVSCGEKVHSAKGPSAKLWGAPGPSAAGGAGCEGVVGWAWREAISAEKNDSSGACRGTRSPTLFCNNVYYCFCSHRGA